MYTNPSNLIAALEGLLSRNSAGINQVIREYQPNRKLSFYEGVRQTLPEAAYPSLEVEATGVSNSWTTTRAQRPRYSFNCMLTTMTTNVDKHHNFSTTLATAIIQIMTSPENLQLAIPNEQIWNPNGGLVNTVILDSLVEDATYSSQQEGAIRVAEFPWFALVNEPFPDSKFLVGQTNQPTIVKP